MRWWDHGFRGEEVGRVLFEVILGGEEDMLSLPCVPCCLVFVCIQFQFGEAANVRAGDAPGLVDAGSSPLLVAAAACFQYIGMLENFESPDIRSLASEIDLSSAEDRRCAGHCRRVRVGPIR